MKNIIKNARRSLAIPMSFERVNDNKTHIFWDGIELTFIVDEGEPTLTAVTVGAIHSLLTHNTRAILDGKTTFDFNDSMQKHVLNIHIPPVRKLSGIQHVKPVWRPPPNN